eukprot:8764694-Alexandrium_andersonii.AAC.1
MASARVQPTRSPPPRFHPTAFAPAATVTMLAREMAHWSTSGGAGKVSRATSWFYRSAGRTTAPRASPGCSASR